ncbi:hypothetical protein Tsubulata_037880 [Turnera subulata]|uniref:Uncharacterized protein n=1 Tax=Turnera subulata TaxID=218843 RepID=A0A9Q0FAI5_9ROSI|nr:hypothetical protein Tsubulata_037880 [Turnera subulata]
MSGSRRQWGYFVKMRDSGFEPDENTMVIMLSLCAEVGDLSLGRWIHCQAMGRELWGGVWGTEGLPIPFSVIPSAKAPVALFIGRARL